MDESSASRYFQSDAASDFDQIGGKSDDSPSIPSSNTNDFEASTKPSSNITESQNSSLMYSNIPKELDMSAASALADDILFSPESSVIRPVSSLLLTDADRAADAWILPPETKEFLHSLSSSPPGSIKIDKEHIVSPGIGIKEIFEDPILNIQKLLGQEIPQEPRTLTSSSVTQDDSGLRLLISKGCYHAAVNLTTQLLSVYGQGERKPGQVAKHTIHSVQLWFTRIALLVKLRRFSLAEVECEAFKDLSSPDLFFEYYPQLYGDRKGSMVPFSFRLLVSELPQYLGRHVIALDRLSKLLSVCEKILDNLSRSYSEDASQTITEEYKCKSAALWNARRVKVLYSLTRCAVGLKDFRLAKSLLQRLLCEEKDAAGLLAALGRLCLHLGDVDSAQEAFNRHLEFCPSGAEHDPVQGLIHSAFISCAKNDFKGAVEILKQALTISPQNGLVINNLAVCLIFTGNVREAIAVVQNAIQKNPDVSLHEALVLNLSTMLELESSDSQVKKTQLLNLISRHKGDGFNTAALKLQV